MKPIKPVTITIDWPAGSGKGTTARLLAKKLGFLDIDTGSMYRTISVYLQGKGADLDTVTKDDMENVSIDFRPDYSIYLNWVEYTDRIRTPEVGQNASRIATQAVVRKCVDDTIRAMLKNGNYVLEGRDMGRVFSEFAQVKIFLTADPAIRAHRRWLELQKKWDQTSEEEILNQIKERDHRDMTREISPLSKSPDAYEIDTSHLTIEEQVEQIYTIVCEKLRITN